MLVDKRPPLLDMACNANFKIRLLQERPIQSAMCVVTIRTFHQALRYTVMCGQRERRLDGPVATVAQVRLLLPEKAFPQPTILFHPYGNLKELGLGQLRFRSGSL